MMARFLYFYKITKILLVDSQIPIKCSLGIERYLYMNDTDQCGTMTIGVTNSLIRNRIKDECKDVLFNSRQCIIK